MSGPSTILKMRWSDLSASYCRFPNLRCGVERRVKTQWEWFVRADTNMLCISGWAKGGWRGLDLCCTGLLRWPFPFRVLHEQFPLKRPASAARFASNQGALDWREHRRGSFPNASSGGAVRDSHLLVDIATEAGKRRCAGTRGCLLPRETCRRWRSSSDVGRSVGLEPLEGGRHSLNVVVNMCDETPNLASRWTMARARAPLAALLAALLPPTAAYMSHGPASISLRRAPAACAAVTKGALASSCGARPPPPPQIRCRISLSARKPARVAL